VELPEGMEEKIKPAQGLQTSSRFEQTKNPGDEAPARGMSEETQREEGGCNIGKMMNGWRKIT
jgi:hypothetical protein